MGSRRPKLAKSTPQSGWFRVSLGFLAIGCLIGVALQVYRPLSRNKSNVEVHTVQCHSASYEPRVIGCSPSSCFRFVVDAFASDSEVATLREFADEALALGSGATGPVSIFDTASGAVSHGDRFISAFAALQDAKTNFNNTRVAVFRSVVRRVSSLLRSRFGLTTLHPATPSFFSRIVSGRDAQTVNDEYWHRHVDTRQYGSFVYTSLLYLSDHGTDFRGGMFRFDGASSVAAPEQVTPKAGSLLIFTSGQENPHRITKVSSGTRYAVTIPWTCDVDAVNTGPLA